MIGSEGSLCTLDTRRSGILSRLIEQLYRGRLVEQSMNSTLTLF